MKQVLSSHGQLSVEWRFSINRQVEVENIPYLERLQEHVATSVRALGGVLNVAVSSIKLLISCSSARHKYRVTTGPGKSWKSHGKVTHNVVKFLQLH